MNLSDPRALALTLFHKFHASLPDLSDEPSDRVLREIVVDAINLLPDFIADTGEKDGTIRIRRTDEDQEKLLNIQETVDSIRTVWAEYQNQHHGAPFQ